MRAVTIERFGPPEGLVPTGLPDPVPGPGQVVIAAEAIGVGGVDAVIRRGTIGRAGIEPGYVPGSEAAGTVVAVADDVDRSWLGRRVWAFTGVGGAYAELVVAAVGDLTHRDVEAAGSEQIAGRLQQAVAVLLRVGAEVRQIVVHRSHSSQVDAGVR